MPQIRNFADVHKLLDRYIVRNRPAGNYSLDRIQNLMKKLGNPQDSYKVVHVAGTSGKTSTCYYMTALLQQAGQKVGLTVSPHVDEVNERVQINLTALPENIFCRELSKFIDIVNVTGIQLTYFELVVAFAYWEFAEQKVDYAVVEVGLGGLLDGTNVVHSPGKVCVITDLGLDHTNVLGKTIAEIAVQKAGIIQDHNLVFVYKQGSEVTDQIVARCTQMHAALHEVTPAQGMAELNIAPFKQRNYFLAKQVFNYIAQNKSWPKLTDDRIVSLNIPARMEVVTYKDKTIIIDGSHNSQKEKALVEGVKSVFPNKSVALLVSFVADDEVGRATGALQQLKHLTTKVIITSFAGEQDSPKQSIDAKEIAKLAKQTGFTQTKIIAKPEQAFEELIKQPEDLLVITGSFYLLNHIRPLLV